MGKKLTGKVILEGTRLTHKTEIAFSLNEHLGFVGPRKYRYHSPVISAEWCGFTNTPWGRGPVNFETKEEEEKALETYETWVRLFELQRYYTWIIDRFHISTQIYQKAVYNREYDFQRLEERLADLGFHLVLVTRSPESFEAAREERLKISGKPSQYDDLQPFIDEQELYRERVRRSLLPSMELDISDSDIGRATDRIVEWMKRTGGLWSPSKIA